ncbi:MAG: hypothetical protein ACXVPN_14575 [Bacteroidia bacterium]
MRHSSKLFISSFICVAFLFRLLVVSFVPGSTATVFPHTTSFKFKGFFDFKKRRRNNDDVSCSVRSSVSENDIDFSPAEGAGVRHSVLRKYVLQIGKLFSLTGLLNPHELKQIFNFSNPHAVFLPQRKVLSVSILRI